MAFSCGLTKSTKLATLARSAAKEDCEGKAGTQGNLVLESFVEKTKGIVRKGLVERALTEQSPALCSTPQEVLHVLSESACRSHTMALTMSRVRNSTNPSDDDRPSRTF